MNLLQGTFLQRGGLKDLFGKKPVVVVQVRTKGLQFF